jgi:hypothetical protein
MFNGGFSVWILGIIFLLLNLTTVGSFDAANCLAILTAILIGISYEKLFSNGIYKLIERISNLFANKGPKPLTFSKAEAAQAYSMKDVSEKKLNEILEKISANGMESLTRQEQEWLKSLKEKI